MNTRETECEKWISIFGMYTLGHGAHYLTKENRDVCDSQLGFVCQDWLPWANIFVNGELYICWKDFC